MISNNVSKKVSYRLLESTYLRLAVLLEKKYGDCLDRTKYDPSFIKYYNN